MKNRFPQRLKELLNIENVKQNEFAQKVGVSPSCVTFWLKGERKPTAENIYIISKTYDVSADYLLGIDEI